MKMIFPKIMKQYFGIYPTTLFSTCDGQNSMYFVLSLKNTASSEQIELIKIMSHCGAVVCVSIKEALAEGGVWEKFSMLLVDHDDVVKFYCPAFTVNFIKDCIASKKLLDISNYRQNVTRHFVRSQACVSVLYYRMMNWPSLVTEQDKQWIDRHVEAAIDDHHLAQPSTSTGITHNTDRFMHIDATTAVATKETTTQEDKTTHAVVNNTEEPKNTAISSKECQGSLPSTVRTEPVNGLSASFRRQLLLQDKLIKRNKGNQTCILSHDKSSQTDFENCHACKTSAETRQTSASSVFVYSDDSDIVSGNELNGKTNKKKLVEDLKTREKVTCSDISIKTRNIVKAMLKDASWGIKVANRWRLTAISSDSSSDAEKEEPCKIPFKRKLRKRPNCEQRVLGQKTKANSQEVVTEQNIKANGQESVPERNTRSSSRKCVLEQNTRTSSQESFSERKSATEKTTNIKNLELKKIDILPSSTSVPSKEKKRCVTSTMIQSDDSETDVEVGNGHAAGEKTEHAAESSTRVADSPVVSTTAKRGEWGRKHSRQPYSREEQSNILRYITKNNLYAKVKGREMWQLMERRKVCPSRTWQSMKEHFIKKIVPNLDLYGFLTADQKFRIRRI